MGSVLTQRVSPGQKSYCPYTPMCGVSVTLFQIQLPASDNGCRVHSYKSPYFQIPCHPKSCSHTTRKPTLFRGFILSLCSTSWVAPCPPSFWPHLLGSLDIILCTLTSILIWHWQMKPTGFGSWLSFCPYSMQLLYTSHCPVPHFLTHSSSLPQIIPLYLYTSWSLWGL